MDPDVQTRVVRGSTVRPQIRSFTCDLASLDTYIPMSSSTPSPPSRRQAFKHKANTSKERRERKQPSQLRPISHFGHLPEVGCDVLKSFVRTGLWAWQLTSVSRACPRHREARYSSAPGKAEVTRKDIAPAPGMSLGLGSVTRLGCPLL